MKRSLALVFLAMVMGLLLSACSSTQTETAAAEDPDALHCTVAIYCRQLSADPTVLPKEKRDLVPSDGVILSEKEVAFTEGENVFDVLLRACRDAKIHLEYTETPMYASSYIEGINNLYEFDGGPMSGWLYFVNDWNPGYGSSSYTLKDGDRIEWHYTTDRGADFDLNFEN